jgi:hypothetical protein
VREVAKSMIGLSWALPLFGAQQAGFLLGGGPGRSRAAAAFEAVGSAAAAELGEGAFESLYRIGTCAQNSALMLAPSLLTPATVNPLSWARVAVEVAERSTAAAGPLAAGRAPLLWQELRDKGEVFCLVLDVSRRIGVPSSPPFPLAELLARCYALGRFPALWAVEGLGHDYGDSFSQQQVTPRGILSAEVTGSLPAESLLMLHAGIGLSFAQQLLAGAVAGTPHNEVCRRVAAIIGLCRDNSREGYLGAAWESLGLVTRSFHGDLVAAVDGALREVAPEALGYYWHGVGRAIYFLPINFLPGSDGAVFTMARSEAPDEEARRSAVAGAAWAFALVAQRQPRVLAELVVGPHGEELARDGAFANGVASSAIMRHDTTPDADFLTRFYRYRPEGADRRLADLWERLVERPCEEALARWYPVIKSRRRLDEVFRYQDLGALVSTLEGTP